MKTYIITEKELLKYSKHLLDWFSVNGESSVSNKEIKIMIKDYLKEEK